MKMAMGNLDGIDGILPDLVNDYLLDPDDLKTDNPLLQQRFIDDYEIMTPYYFVYFSQEIVVFGITSILTILACYFGYKIFKKIT